MSAPGCALGIVEVLLTRAHACPALDCHPADTASCALALARAHAAAAGAPSAGLQDGIEVLAGGAGLLELGGIEAEVVEEVQARGRQVLEIQEVKGGQKVVLEGTVL